MGTWGQGKAEASEQDGEAGGVFQAREQHVEVPGVKRAPLGPAAQRRLQCGDRPSSALPRALALGFCPQRVSGGL